jgi:hypothetical protein
MGLLFLGKHLVFSRWAEKCLNELIGISKQYKVCLIQLVLVLATIFFLTPFNDNKWKALLLGSEGQPQKNGKRSCKC